MIDPLAGQSFGQYELQDRLGRGGMAAVYRAVQPSLGRQVAIKVLPLDQVPDPTLPERFRREARMAANLMHPNIVPVYDFGEWQGYLYIVMALVSGGTLKERVHGPLPVETAVRLVGQVADALGYAHGQGIYHCDVKPTNVLLASGDWTMLSDFGIARALGETTRLTSPYGTIGTPAYMAPEQWLGGEVDGRADLYSLGVVLYELLAGSPPFTATTSQGLMRQHLETPVPPLASRRPDLPPGLDQVVQTALAKAPDQRYRHVGELKAALEAALRLPPGPDQSSRTDLASSGPFMATSPHVGQTMRVADQLRTPAADRPRHNRSGMPTSLRMLVLAMVVLLAGAVGYLVAGGRLGAASATLPTSTTEAAAGASISTLTPQSPPTATPQPAPTATPLIVVVTATPPPPTPTTPPSPTAQPATVREVPTATPPTATAPQPIATTVSQPVAPAKVPPTPAAPPDPRFALIERHVSDYFAALNVGDYARAQAVCCTPGWRTRYPLDEWRRNFSGVTDLRFATPFRYPTVEAGRIVAEVDYTFVNSSGARRNFTLRWTFVPVESDWLADEATASPRP